ncbi:MAG: hypothetical protein GDA44_09440 [Prochloron sp. SP5CPC1]|nr:hypothetical protein [Candidatus Paraprochloron terpiosi SP5CPC1]
MSDTEDKKTVQRIETLILEDEDVISLGGYTYKVSQLKEAFNKLYDKNLWEDVRKYLGSIGVPLHFDTNLFGEPECEGLQQSGGGWKKGKFKIQFVIETCYDEEKREEQESPLDDIRRSLNENGS